MKTTIELDDEKLLKIMKMMDFKTRKEAIDWALTEAERLAVMHHIKANPWSAEFLKDAVDPDYDVLATRRAVRSNKEAK
jgi:Arc/MetJ family transcription regulator